MNKANAHMMANLSQALKCAAVLDKNGLTITAINLSGRRPCIEVQHTKKLEQVPSISVAIKNNGSGRYEMLSTDVSGTNVQWQQPIN